MNESFQIHYIKKESRFLLNEGDSSKDFHSHSFFWSYLLHLLIQITIIPSVSNADEEGIDWSKMWQLKIGSSTSVAGTNSTKKLGCTKVLWKQ